MSLNNNQMLPARVRNMRQMKEILDAEDIVLAEIERMIDEMYQRASMLHEELVNEEWLEKHIEEITGGKAIVTKKKDELYVEVVVSRGVLASVKAEKVIRFLNKWLPAHLQYQMVYEQLLRGNTYAAAVWQDDEVMTLRQVNV